MIDRTIMKRILERMGFQHVAGWVRKEDAPGIVAKIRAAKAEVEAIKAEQNKARTVQTHPAQVQTDGNKDD